MIPLVAHFSPGSVYFPSPKSLTHCTLYLSLIRLSYPLWEKKAKELRDDIKWQYKNIQTHIILSNLILMADYFIPLVSP